MGTFAINITYIVNISDMQYFWHTLMWVKRDYEVHISGKEVHQQLSRNHLLKRQSKKIRNHTFAQFLFCRLLVILINNQKVKFGSSSSQRKQPINEDSCKIMQLHYKVKKWWYLELDDHWKIWGNVDAKEIPTLVEIVNN